MAEPLPESADEIFEQMAHLVGEEERRAFFRRRPELVSARQLEQACAEVNRLVGISSERAIELAASVRFLADLLGGPGPRGLAARAAANAYHFAGQCELAQELYQQALGLFDQAGDRLGGAITRSSALTNLAYLGELARVATLEAEARQVFTERGDRLRLAILDNNLANALTRQDRWAEALERYGAAHREFVLQGRARDAAICLRNVASCHVSLHHFAEALQVYQESRDFCLEQGLDLLVVEADYNIAYLYFLRGEYTAAIGRYEAARAAAEQAGDAYHQALCDLDLAEIYLELNLAADAARLAAGAHQLFGRLKLSYEAAKALTLAALAESRRGGHAKALDQLEEARRSFEREGNRLWPAQIDFYRAVLLGRCGRPTEAVALARAACAAFAGSGVLHRALLSQILLASLLLDQGATAAGRHQAADAVRRLTGLALPALEQLAFRVLGRAAELGRDSAGALAAYGRALELLEGLRGQLLGEDLKIAFLQDKRDLYEALFCLELGFENTPVHQPFTQAGNRPTVIPAEAGTQSPSGSGEGDWGLGPGLRRGDDRGISAFSTTLPDRKSVDSSPAARALVMVEKAKSRSLLDLLAFRAASLRSHRPEHSADTEEARRLREELSWHYRQLDLALLAGERGEAAAKLRDGALALEDELLRRLGRLQRADRELGSLQAPAPFDLEACRATLPPGGALVEYFLAKDEIYAAVLRPDSLEIRALGAAARCRERWRLLQFELSRCVPGRPAPAGLQAWIDRAAAEHLRALGDLLMAPLLPLLAGIERLVLAPHGFLHYLPFHALALGPEESLIDRFELSYIPSAAVFQLCQAKTPIHGERVALLGVADARAPHIAAEIAALQAIFPAAEVSLGAAAGEDALRRATGSRIVHLAAHAHFRRDNPMFSAIQLGASRLSLFDLYDLELDADLVTLSGCGTGLAAVAGADELLGLARGLLYAGARSLLLSLWDVHDASTAALMSLFYRELAAGARPAAALRQVMLAHRRDHPRPYHWAPFILVGSP